MDGFRFEYDPATIRCGRGAVAKLGEELTGAERGQAETGRVDPGRALVVCGTGVGATDAVVEPVRAGLGDSLAGVAAETTPDKRVETAVRVRDRARELDAGTLVGLGGGSSLDVARVAAALHGTGLGEREARERLRETGTVPVGDPLAVAAVPTTLAGADLSSVAGITTTADEGEGRGVVHGGVGDPRLMPRVLVADPDLVATTPVDVLAGSAMNGFDKAVETPYARTATPVTDATAVRALATLRDALPELRAAVDGADDAAGDGHGAPDGDPVGDAVEGVVLAQYGVSRPDGSTLSLVHAFGHALSRPYDLQQGVAHAVVAPATLEYLLEAGVARRDLLARGLGVRTAGRADRAVDRATVEAVAAVRDGLGLPARLRDVDGPEPGDFPAVADAVLADGFTPTTPLEPTREELVAVLERAW